MPARPDGRPPKRPLASDALELPDPDRPARWLPRPCLRSAARQHRDVARVVPPHGHQARCGHRRGRLWVIARSEQRLRWKRPPVPSTVAKQPLQLVAVAAWTELAPLIPTRARPAVAARQRSPKAKRGDTAFLPPGPRAARWTASIRRRLLFVHGSMATGERPDRFNCRRDLLSVGRGGFCFGDRAGRA